MCDAGYADWAWRSCTEPGVAAGVLLAEWDGTIAAFATMDLHQADRTGEGVLFAVAPPFQGLGIYTALIREAMQWCIRHGCTHMEVSTQITNLAVQKAWVRLGFEPSASWYTLHKWF